MDLRFAFVAKILAKVALAIRRLGLTRTDRRYAALGDAARDCRNWAEAEAFYKLCLDVRPTLANIWMQLGHMQKEQGKYGEAERAYERALELGAFKGEGYLQLGHLHKVAGHIDKAEAAYQSAYLFDRDRFEARDELLQIGWPMETLQKLGGAERVKPNNTEATRHHIVVDLSDAIDHLKRSATITGIQRVQLSLCQALLEYVGQEQSTVVFFEPARNGWVEASPQLQSVLFQNLGSASTTSLVSRLVSDHFFHENYELSPGATLINFGASWQYANYFLAIRNAQSHSNIRYVAFVHDCIPLVYPDLCAEGVPAQYKAWLMEVSECACLLLANSNNTKLDIEKYARLEGSELPPIEVIHLNARFHSVKDRKETGKGGQLPSSVLKLYGLVAGKFVLLVSTIEPRKSHATVFEAWVRLIEMGSVVPVPKLVCVGKRGWKEGAIVAAVEQHPYLRQHVLLLTEVPDQHLAILYASCLFTVFPSLYEGWGLPISEALSFGKIPIVSDVASHREAAGELGVYFTPECSQELCSKVVELANDSSQREVREKTIAGNAPLRSWTDIARQVLDVCRKRLPVESSSSKVQYQLATRKPEIAIGAYQFLGLSEAKPPEPACFAGGRYRRGTGWGEPTRNGCPMGRVVHLSFSVVPNDFELVMSLDFYAKRIARTSIKIVVNDTVFTCMVDVPTGVKWRENFAVKLSGRCDVTLEFPDGEGYALRALELQGFVLCRHS